MAKIGNPEFDRLVAAAEKSLFPQFWADLLWLVRVTRFSPGSILTARKPLVNVPRGFQDASDRLWEEECPFGLKTSRFGSESLLKALRVLGRRAGLDDWRSLHWEALKLGR